MMTESPLWKLVRTELVAATELGEGMGEGMVVEVVKAIYCQGGGRGASSWMGGLGFLISPYRWIMGHTFLAHFTFFPPQPKLSTIQRKVQKAVGWSKGFPGAQPVSMDRKNIGFLAEKPYMVSWKADGTRFLTFFKKLLKCFFVFTINTWYNFSLPRYMMLVDGENEVYFLDRDNCVFQVIEHPESRI